MRPLRLASNFIGFHHVKTSLARQCRHKSGAPDHRFPERFVQINTCGSLYKKWREERVYRKVPDGDLSFRVPFIDSRPEAGSSSASPVVVALHGAPGSWRDYLPLASFLHDRGCRVIAPSFPDFSVYKPGIFRHSDVERASYIRDFLDAISVNHIDLLISHSSAVYPSLQLCLSNAPEIKSLTLLNPGTFDLEGMSTKPHRFMKFFMKTSENPFGLKFLDIFGSFMLKKLFKVSVRFESILDPLLSATVMMRANIPESKEKFIAVSQKMPILYVFSEDDPVISKNPSYKVAEALGAKTSDIFIYDKDLCLAQEGTILPRLKVIAMKEGSHYVFLKHQALINNEILDFVKRQGFL